MSTKSSTMWSSHTNLYPFSSLVFPFIFNLFNTIPWEVSSSASLLLRSESLVFIVTSMMIERERRPFKNTFKFTSTCLFLHPDWLILCRDLHADEELSEFVARMPPLTFEGLAEGLGAHTESPQKNRSNTRVVDVIGRLQLMRWGHGNARCKRNADRCWV